MTTTTKPHATYPRHWEADVLLRDGQVAHLRPIDADDQELLVAFYEEVSAESKYLRFFAPMPRLSERDVLRFTNVDHVNRVAFVLTVARKMIAVGRFDRIPPEETKPTGRRRGRGGVPGPGRPPGPGHREPAARAPRPGRP